MGAGSPETSFVLYSVSMDGAQEDKVTSFMTVDCVLLNNVNSFPIWIAESSPNFPKSLSSLDSRIAKGPQCIEWLTECGQITFCNLNLKMDFDLNPS